MNSFSENSSLGLSSAPIPEPLQNSCPPITRSSPLIVLSLLLLDLKSIKFLHGPPTYSFSPTLLSRRSQLDFIVDFSGFFSSLRSGSQIMGNFRKFFCKNYPPPLSRRFFPRTFFPSNRVDSSWGVLVFFSWFFPRAPPLVISLPL